MGIISSVCGSSNSGDFVVVGEILDPSTRSLCIALTESGVPFTLKDESSLDYKMYMRNHSELELPVLMHGTERINSNVFAQLLYMSKVEPKLRDTLYTIADDSE